MSIQTHVMKSTERLQLSLSTVSYFLLSSQLQQQHLGCLTRTILVCGCPDTSTVIQASDISHTMQHWHVYRTWNKNLFEELYVAYLNGRMAGDPTEFWYKGAITCFDFS